jgi:hypothetical protein
MRPKPSRSKVTSPPIDDWTPPGVIVSVLPFRSRVLRRPRLTSMTYSVPSRSVRRKRVGS